MLTSVWTNQRRAGGRVLASVPRSSDVWPSGVSAVSPAFLRVYLADRRNKAGTRGFGSTGLNGSTGLDGSTGVTLLSPDPVTMDEVFLRSAPHGPGRSGLDDTSLALPAGPAASSSARIQSAERSLRVQQQVQLTLARRARRSQSNGNNPDYYDPCVCLWWWTWSTQQLSGGDEEEARSLLLLLLLLSPLE